ncbi:MAG: hypothetical protein FGM24_04415 [Candidatus Kapabacteria bacterium]|nr:hypothetical protein [Candidatus Kapabacteria bacterium]
MRAWSGKPDGSDETGDDAGDSSSLLPRNGQLEVNAESLKKCPIIHQMIEAAVMQHLYGRLACESIWERWRVGSTARGKQQRELLLWRHRWHLCHCVGGCGVQLYMVCRVHYGHSVMIGTEIPT